MHVHANPIVWEVRVYSSDINADGTTGYDRREKAIAILLVRRLETDNECYASMLMGAWSPTVMRAVRKKAREHGFEWIKYERHGGHERIRTE
jgi:hypothetical protein